MLERNYLVTAEVERRLAARDTRKCCVWVRSGSDFLDVFPYAIRERDSRDHLDQALSISQIWIARTAASISRERSSGTR
jgi:hypothetical protein